MGLIADLKLLRDLKRAEKTYGTTPTRNNPLVHLFGHEKSYGKPAPHDFSTFIENFASWAYTCAYKNAFSVAQVPLKLYQKVPGEKNQTELEEITEHPFLELMQNVNPHFNKFELKSLTSIFLDITGNAYWWVIRDNLGVPRLIWNLPAQWIKIIPNKNNFIDGFVMTVPGKGEKIPFDAEDIIHFKFPSVFDVHYGCPPMYGAAYDIDLNKQFKTFGINYLLNNAQPSGVLVADDALNKEQRDRLQLAWKMRHQGTNNAGKIAILEAGLKYQKIGSGIGEMKFDGVNKGIRDGILAAFGVPASKLGLVEDVNRANADANDYTYQKETISPRLSLIEEKLNEKMMPWYDPALVVKFDNPVPEDKEFRLKQKAEHIKMGYAAIDEERQEDGLDPLNLPETAVPLIPFNVVPAGSATVAGTEPEQGKGLIHKEVKIGRRRKWEAFAMLIGPQERMFAKVLKRFFEHQRRIVMGNLNKYRSYSKDTVVKTGIEADIIFSMQEEVERLKEISRPHIDEAYKSGLSLGYHELGRTIDFDLLGPNILRAIEQRVGFFAGKINDSTVKLIAEALKDSIAAGESIAGAATRLDRIFDFSENFRSTRIARTEIVGSANSGQLQGYRDAGVEEKMWITARDERVRDSHIIDGQVVTIAENFKLNSGVLLQYPGDRTGGAPVGELVNCRCTVNPIVKKG